MVDSASGSYSREQLANCGINIGAILKPGELTEEKKRSALSKLKQRAFDDLTCADSRGGVTPETEGRSKYDGEGTGDGAGILTNIPHKLLKRELKEIPEKGKYGLGHFYLPKDDKEREVANSIIAAELEKLGLKITAKRDTPKDAEILSTSSFDSMPKMEQMIVVKKDGTIVTEEELLTAQGHIEAAFQKEKINSSVCSLSKDHVIYKGLLRAVQLKEFFDDLKDDDFELDSYIIHTRYSTNSKPDWSAAQPFTISHNGEFNTHLANIFDRKYREERKGEVRRSDIRGSDTLELSRATSILRSSYNLSLAQSLLASMPPFATEDMSDEDKDFIEYLTQLIRPVSGPAHIVSTFLNEKDERIVMSMRDPSGLRPSNIDSFKEDGVDILTISSESRIEAKDEITDLNRTRPTSGGMTLINTVTGETTTEQQIFQELKDKFKFDHEKYKSSKATEEKLEETELADFSTRTSQKAYWDKSTIKVIDALKNGHEQLVAMGDDSRIAALKGRPITITDLLKEKFQMVTAPPLDASCENSTISTAVYLGGRPGDLGEYPEIIKIKSPIIEAGKLEIYKSKLKSATLDITMGLVETESAEATMTSAIKALCQEAEKEVKSGKTLIILSDANLKQKGRAQIPDVVAIAAINQHLQEKGLRHKTSIVAECATVTDSHKASALLAFGADAVNPYMAYQYAKDTTKPSDLERVLENIQSGLTEGHIRVLSRLGFSRTLSYIDGRGSVLEALGLDKDSLNKSEISDVFSSVSSKSPILSIASFAKMAVAMAEKAESRSEAIEFPDYGAAEERNYSQKWIGSFRKMIQENEISDEQASQIAKQNPKNEGIGHLDEKERRLFYSLDVLGNEAALSRAVFAMQIFYDMDSRKDKLTEKEKDLLTNLSQHAQYKEWIAKVFPEIALSTESAGKKLAEYEGNPFIDIQRKDSPAWEIFKTHLLEKKQGKDATKSFGIGGAVKINGRYTKEWIDSYKTSEAFITYKETTEEYHKSNPSLLHHHIDVSSKRKPIDVSEVEPMSDILRRFSSGAMSYGSLKWLTHGDIAEAHNAIGSAGSNDGEGGMVDRLHGTIRSGASKQYASGQFGMHSKLLDDLGNSMGLSIEEDEAGVIQIKIAQGAKPGVGGELPGKKVDEEIALTRKAIPGQTLASPPPLHDLYSIEDLKSLIMAMRAAGKKVSVKLAATSGVGTIAAGVAKAGADEINIACASGGTGAAKHFDQKNVGQPGILGLIEAHNALVKEGLRNNVKLIASGGFQTTKDFLLHALWADGFETGTIQLGSAGCIAIDECYKAAEVTPGDIKSGGCSTGITNTAWNYKGKVANAERLTLDFAASLRDELARIGYKSIDDFKKAYHSQREVGEGIILSLNLPELDKNKFLTKSEIKKAKKELLSEITHREVGPSGKKYNPEDKPTPLEFKELKDRKDDKLKSKILQDLAAHDHKESKFKKEYECDLTLSDAAFGMGFLNKKVNPEQISDEYKNRSLYSMFRTRDESASTPLTSKTQYGNITVEKDAVHIKTKGVSGQRYGSFLSHGVHLDHTGRLQDSVGNGISGGVISVTPEDSMQEKANENVIMGNSCFYGASGGEAYINGSVGERFAIRNSGASIVVSGNVGDYACEYMVRGSVVLLGSTGKGLGARMAGGVSAVYSLGDNIIDTRYVKKYNGDGKEDYLSAIKSMLEEQVSRNGSKHAQTILGDWENNKDKFSIVLPERFISLQEDLGKRPSSPKYKAAKEQFRKIFTVYEDKSYTITPLEKVWLEQTKSILRKTEKKQEGDIRELLPMPYFSEQNVSALLEAKKAEHKSYHPVKNIYTAEGKHSEEYVKDLIEHLAKTLPRKITTQEAKIKDIEDLVATPAKDSSKKPSPASCSCSAATCQGEDGCSVGRDTQQGARDSEKALKASFVQLGTAEKITRELLDGNLSKELQKLFNAAYHDYAKTSPLLLTGFICPAPCQSACTKTEAGVPVPIKGWESLLSIYAQYYPEQSIAPYFKVIKPTSAPKSIAVIGSGPAGLESALKLARQGHNITVFEKSDKAGGLATYGIPSEKGVDRLTTYYVEKLKEMGVKFELNKEITHKDQLQGFDSTIIATGVSDKPRWLNIEVRFVDGNGQVTGDMTLEHAIEDGDISGITQAMDLLPEFNKADIGEEAQLPNYKDKKVLTIGAGDTGTDILTSLAKLDDDRKPESVTSVKRDIHLDDKPKIGTGFPFTPEVKDPARQTALKALGAKDIATRTPIAIECNSEGKLQAVIFQKREVVASTESLPKSKRKFKIVKGEERIEADQLILALGFEKAKNPLIKSFGEGDEKPYLTGDIASSPKDWTVVSALASANKTAESLLKKLGVEEIDPQTTLSATESTLALAKKEVQIAS